jgi:hypothetical protein
MLKFEFSLTSKWYEDVARERLGQLAFGYHLKILAADLSGLIETHAPALAPSQFLSRDELLAYSVLQDAYHLDVDNISKQYGRLSIREWLRGYAVLKEMCKPDSPSPKLDILHFQRAELLSSLRSAGLNNDSAEFFIDAATLSRGKRDLFDAPLILDTEGDLHLMTPVLFSAALPLIIVRKLAILVTRWRREPHLKLRSVNCSVSMGSPQRGRHIDTKGPSTNATRWHFGVSTCS